MSRHVRAWRAAAVLAMAASAVGGCSRPDWARGDKAPAPPPTAVAATAAPPGPPPAPGPAATMTVPGMPAWLGPMLGKNPRDFFGKNGVCKGNTDNVVKDRPPGAPGVEIVGWGFDVATGKRVERVILVDEDYVIVGGGESGMRRRDVMRVYPDITDAGTGWTALTAMKVGPVDAYGVVGGGTAMCPLGHLVY